MVLVWAFGNGIELERHLEQNSNSFSLFFGCFLSSFLLEQLTMQDECGWRNECYQLDWRQTAREKSDRKRKKKRERDSNTTRQLECHIFVILLFALWTEIFRWSENNFANTVFIASFRRWIKNEIRQQKNETITETKICIMQINDSFFFEKWSELRANKVHEFILLNPFERDRTVVEPEIREPKWVIWKSKKKRFHFLVVSPFGFGLLHQYESRQYKYRPGQAGHGMMLGGEWQTVDKYRQ